MKQSKKLYESDKYDRQIRLFGHEIQEKLSKAVVKIEGTVNFISAEILKNLVLLGVSRIDVADASLIEKVKELIPDKLEDINENLKIEFSEANGERETYDIVFSVDVLRNERFFYICSKCLSIDKSEHTECCENKFHEEIRAVYECMIGGLAVQEFVKSLENKNTIEYFTVNELF